MPTMTDFRDAPDARVLTAGQLILLAELYARAAVPIDSPHRIESMLYFHRNSLVEFKSDDVRSVLTARMSMTFVARRDGGLTDKGRAYLEYILSTPLPELGPRYEVDESKRAKPGEAT